MSAEWNNQIGVPFYMQNTVVAVAVEAACAVAYINLAFYLAYRRPVNHAETLAFTIFRFRVN